MAKLSTELGKLDGLEDLAAAAMDLEKENAGLRASLKKAESDDDCAEIAAKLDGFKAKVDAVAAQYPRNGRLQSLLRSLY